MLNRNELFVIYYDPIDEVYLHAEISIFEFVHELYKWREWGRPSATTLNLAERSPLILTRLVEFANERLDYTTWFNNKYSILISFEMSYKTVREQLLMLNAPRKRRGIA